MSAVDLRRLIDPEIFLREFGPLPVGKASQFSLVVFQGFIQSAQSLAVAYSNPALDNLLGLFDQLAVDVTVSGVRAQEGPVSLTVYQEHSADGVYWHQKRPTAMIDAPSYVSMTGPTVMEIGYDDGKTPSLGLVRFFIRLFAPKGPVRGYVRVHVTANDSHEREFSAAVAKLQDSLELDEHAQCYPAGTPIDVTKIQEAAVASAVAPFIDRTRSTAQWPYGSGTIVFKDQVQVCFTANGGYFLTQNGRFLWRPYTPADPTAHGPSPQGDVPSHTQPVQGGATLVAAGDPVSPHLPGRPKVEASSGSGVKSTAGDPKP